MTARAGDILADTSRRVHNVLRWHVAAPPRHGRRLCTECGMPYPCRTRAELLGHKPAVARKPVLPQPRPPKGVRDVKGPRP